MCQAVQRTHQVSLHRGLTLKVGKTNRAQGLQGCGEGLMFYIQLSGKAFLRTEALQVQQRTPRVKTRVCRCWAAGRGSGPECLCFSGGEESSVSRLGGLGKDATLCSESAVRPWREASQPGAQQRKLLFICPLQHRKVLFILPWTLRLKQPCLRLERMREKMLLVGKEEGGRSQNRSEIMESKLLLEQGWRGNLWEDGLPVSCQLWTNMHLWPAARPCTGPWPVEGSCHCT